MNSSPYSSSSVFNISVCKTQKEHNRNVSQCGQWRYVACIHYIHQCCLHISEVLWRSPKSNFAESAHYTILYIVLENYASKIIATSPRGQWVNMVPHARLQRAVYWKMPCLNSLRPRLNRRPFADDIFKCIFLNENEWILLRISLKYVP